MTNVVPLLLKNLSRNPVRTLLTLGGVTVALFVFCAILALDNGVDRMVKTTGSEHVLTVFERYKACPPLSRLPVHYQDRIRAVPGVQEVSPTLFQLSHCSTATDLVAVHGIEAEKFRRYRQVDIPDEQYAAFSSERGAAIVGERIAQTYGWRVGDVVTLQKLQGVSFTIRGIFSAPGSSLENTILVDLEYLQYSTDRVGEATQLYVLVDHPAQSARVSAEIDRQFSNETTPTKTGPERSFISTAIGDVRGLIEFSQFIAYLAVLIIFAGVANSISMSMRDRVREIAILKTLGFRRRRILGLILTESLVVCALGGLLGSALAYAVVNNSTFVIAVEGFSVAPYVGPRVLAYSVALSLGIGALGALIPAWRASRRKIVTALREVD